MTDVSTMQDLTAVQNQPVFSSDGEKIGKVEEIFHDVETDKPEWLGVGTGFFSSKRVLVPVAGSQVREDSVYVNYSKDQVQDSPDIDGDEISQETEAQLYSYYGIEYGEDRSDTGLPEGGEATGTSESYGTTDDDGSRDEDTTPTDTAPTGTAMTGEETVEADVRKERVDVDESGATVETTTTR